MDSQSIAYLIVYAVAIGFGILLLAILRGVIQWWFGVSDIIRLLEKQNGLLDEQNKLLSAQSRNVSKPTIARAETENRPSPLTNR